MIVLRPLSLVIVCTMIASTPCPAAPRCCGNEELPAAMNAAQQPDEPTTQPDMDDEDESKEKDKWNVNDPPGPKFDVNIDANSGTWMSLDVSPDGNQIVFDLLGDIYTLPIAGGQAKPLTSGIAWDMQPRYSPDGKYIAFTSDRGNGDNIWIIDRSGGEPTQVTKEDFRLLNSPVWTPDSQYIAARKHFTSRRSAGAGEVWLYHRSGGEGLKMTERPNDQKDLGEPAFSPDGRYLYYSQDATPGNTFEYNKDSNTQIYVINRLDRQTGETERLVTGPGGAVRPTPSPDGKWLAFVRRVQFKTHLFLRHLESGAEFSIHAHLERDMQEAWAIHGVYPTMAWTPDSKSIVFWAAGKIQRIDIDSKQVSEIPFHVKDTRTVTEAIRLPVEVSPDDFPVKLLRWVDVSPAGDKVVYQALGHLYVRDLPDGTPRRLTMQNEHFEYFPSFSRDGRSIVYTTFDDDQLGAVRVVESRGGEGRVVTDRPGHYVQPCISPDGNTIVYRRIGKGSLRSPRWSHDTGVYQVPFAGGESQLITKKGADPQFGAASDRVFLFDVKREDKEDRRTLFSIDLDGSDERTHLVSKNAVQFRVSPDEKWIAFSERFNAYLAPFVLTGKEVEIGPKAKNIPVAKVSRDAGLNLDFSGDSQAVYWSLGPDLFTRELRDAFAFLEGAPEELPEPVAEGVNISFTAKTDVPEGSVAFVGAKIITMRGDEVIEDGAILVERNRIKAVGPRGDLAIASGVHTVDATGMVIMPGLVDVHAHGGQGESGFIPKQNWGNFASLAFGRTTIHDPSNDTETFFAAAELARAGRVVAPRLFSTGTILYGAAGSFKAEIETLDDARSHLRRMQKVGAFSVKSYNQPRRDQRQKVLEAARELGMMVVPEGGSLFQHNMNMVVDGHTGIEHCVPVAHVYDDVVQLWSQTKVGYTPTLTVSYGGISGEFYWYHHDNVWENERLTTFVPPFVVDPRSRRRQMAPEEEYNHIAIAAHCKKLADAGVKVNIGAHGQMDGIDAHWEMWMLGQGGMTPLEVIRCATINGALYVGLDGHVGSLEPGKLADLIVLEADPLVDLRNTEQIRYTMINGRLFDARTMNQIGNHPQPRGKFFWETEFDGTTH